MNTKNLFLLLSRIFTSIGLIFLSVLLFPKININYFSLNNALLTEVWIAIPGIAIILSVIVGFLYAKSLSIIDRILPIFFTCVLFAVSWVEDIFLQYDTTSRKLIFNGFAIIALITGILLSAYLLRSAIAIYKKKQTAD